MKKDEVRSLKLEEEPFRQASVFPWGGWATAGIGLAVFFVFVGVQGLTVAFVPERLDNGNSSMIDGDALALATCVSAVVCTGLLALLVATFKRPRMAFYFGWQPISWKTMTRWTGLGIATALFCDRITEMAGRPVVPEFMTQAYATADLIPLLWIALIVAAPLFEETFFRGFLLTGFAGSRIGAGGAILLTSLIWAVIHLQYQPFEMTIVFLIGVLLGLARVMTQSLYVPFVMHAGINLMATTQTALQ